MKEFLEALKTQRWDDHRYYHHSRINQSLHFVSATSFLCSYVLLFFQPVAATLLGWLVAMTARQSGHFFFEPKGYDQVNQATHEYKELIKVGYNLRRKVLLYVAWALAPLPLLASPTLFGVFAPPTTAADYVHHVSMIWLVVGGGGLLLRTKPVLSACGSTKPKKPGSTHSTAGDSAQIASSTTLRRRL